MEALSMTSSSTERDPSYSFSFKRSRKRRILTDILFPPPVLSFVPIWGGAEIWWIGLAISSHGAERKKGAIPTAESVSPALLYLDLEREEFSWVTEDRSSWVGEGG